MVQAIGASSAVGKVVLQGLRYGAKGDFVPGDFGLGKQPGFDGFKAGIEYFAEQSGAVVQVDLADVDDAHHAEQLLHFKLRTGFFHRLAGGPIGSAFAQLHEACGQGPFAESWLDVALAQ